MKIKRTPILSSYAAQIKYLLAFVRFLHNNPLSNVDFVSNGCKISESTFYRYLLMASEFDVKIVSVPCAGEKCRYEIIDCGVFDKNRL